MGKASLGIGVCLGDEKMKERALKSMLEYKKQIVNAMRWYESKKDSEFVTKGKGFMIINAQNEVMHTIIGTLASILSKSNELPDNTYILSMAKLVDGNSKVSIRKSGRNNEEDLKGVMGRIVAGIEGCEAGGHQNAAGALVPMDREEEFVARAKEILASLAMEEKVV